MGGAGVHSCLQVASFQFMNTQLSFHKDTFIPAGDFGIMGSGRNKEWMNPPNLRLVLLMEIKY